MEYLISMLTPIVSTIAGTIAGTEFVKRIYPGVSARTITYLIWLLVAAIVWVIFDLLPLWLVVLVLFASSGLYSQILKKPINFVLGERRKTVGGGGGGPR